jgi:hypothetical protein
VQFPGLRGLPPLQQCEERVLGLDQVAEKFGQWALRVGQGETLDVVSELLDGFGRGASDASIAKLRARSAAMVRMLLAGRGTAAPRSCR